MDAEPHSPDPEPGEEPHPTPLEATPPGPSLPEPQEVEEPQPEQQETGTAPESGPLGDPPEPITPAPPPVQRRSSRTSTRPNYFGNFQFT